MPVPNSYRFLIANEYNLTAADNTEITAGKSKKIKWDKGYPGFKLNIRRHLKHEQKNRCAFCRIRVSVGTAYSNLEHLVGKTDYPQFEFLSKNLAYCCQKCNFSKVAKQTLATPNAIKSSQIYPIVSNGFTIVNPYHDLYENHFDFIDQIIITVINNSSKGLNTIEAYKLSRVELAEERAYEHQVDMSTLNKQLISRLLDPSITQDTITQINNIIADLPNWEV
ncbi:hypothetical protein [Pedobacter frigidisoli]|uniref:hypothetical protein n=1 Tax=Pedobacter frigidisoli TaxID=2530455 RepID=UPI00292ECC9A|nr:hypothetical protein [Pedobacter frigidisoli]